MNAIGGVAFLFSCVGVVSGADAPTLSRKDSRLPNVVMFTFDAARPDHFSAFGYDRPTTPNLEQIAARGVRFDQAYSQAPWTLPSFLSLFSSRYPEFTAAEAPGSGDRGERLAESLGRRGYRTAAFVHGLPMDASLGITRGFGRVYGGDNARFTEDLVAAAAAWAKAEPEAPFFLWIHAFETHFPYLCPRQYRERFDPQYAGPVHGWDIDEDTRLHGRFVDHFNRLAKARPNPPYAFDQELWDFIPRLQASPKDIRHFEAHYDGCIRYVDAQLGALRASLERAGTTNDTIWIVAADHGENLGAGVGGRPPRISHPFNDLHETVLRVPLVIAAPALRGGARVKAPVMLLDIGPTLFGLLGLPGLAGAQGTDLTPWLRDATRELSPHAGVYSSSFLFNGAWGRAFRTGRWKLLREDASWRLFDLASDPEERADVSGSAPERFLETVGAYLNEQARAGRVLNARDPGK